METTKSKIEVSGFETMADSMEFADNYNNWILSKYEPYIGENLLEIGTGQGNFKKYLQGKVKTHVSIDIDADVIARAKQRDPKGHYVVADISSDDFADSLAAYKFQSIICINVLEHVPDHQAGLINMMKLLQPGGHLLLFVPAYMHLYNDLDKLAGHLRRYKKTDIKSMLKNHNNFQIEINEYFNPVGAFGWWLNKLKKHERINSDNVNKQVIIFDKYMVPISKLANPVFRSFWGQSLYCVIKKIN